MVYSRFLILFYSDSDEPNFSPEFRYPKFLILKIQAHFFTSYLTLLKIRDNRIQIKKIRIGRNLEQKIKD